MPPSVFISYSHKDEVWKDRLVTHLGVLEEQNLLRTWNDRNLRTGDLWLDGIQSEIDGARVAVLLVSASSLTSKFILHKEVPRFLELRKKAGMTIFPVIVKDCAWKKVPWLSQFQIRPLDAKPLALRGIRIDSELRAIAEEILEIIAGGSPTGFASAPFSTGTSLPALHQIPTPPADFTGRAEDLSALKSALTEGGTGAIFGLQGMGGVGKTTLALKLAEELESLYPDAQLYLDLKGVDTHPLSTTQAMAHVIRSFHPEVRLPESDTEMAGLYRSVLHGKRMFLLMDNAWDGAQVEPLIPPARSLLLMTSRFHFTLPGLIVRDLGELPDEDACNLLLSIAPRIGSAAAEIARLCGRLPLALRLAGSALAERAYLSTADYARRLKEGTLRFDRVEASLNLSYELLSEDLRRLWRLLAVFPGNFDAVIAVAVWDLEIDPAADVLAELVRSSLVEWEEMDGRYRLHDLARSFADQRLEGTEKEIARRRHAEHYLTVLRVADHLYYRGGESQLLALQLFDREWENIEEGQAWAARNVSEDDEAAGICIDYSTAGSSLLKHRRHPWDRISWGEHALAAAQQLKNRKAEGDQLGILGIAFRSLGEPQRAIELYEHQLAIVRDANDQLGEGHTLHNLGRTYADQGDLRRAINFYEQCLPIARDNDDRHGESNAFGNLGLAYATLGEHRRATEFYEQQLTIAKEIGDRVGEGLALGSLGIAHAALGEPQRAVELCEKHLSIMREIGDRFRECRALCALGLAYETLGESLRAIEIWEQDLAMAREIGDRVGEAYASWFVGLAREKEGDLDNAVALMQPLSDYYREISHLDAEKHDSRVAALRARIAEQKP